MDAPQKRSRLDGDVASAPDTSTTATSTHKKFPPRVKKKKRGFVKGDPSWDGCRCWLQRKNRYCKFIKFKDTDYCAHHLAELKKPVGDAQNAQLNASSAQSKMKRVPCPHDPRHDVYEHRLKKHLKKCPKYKEAVAGAAKPYYKKGLNSCAAVAQKSRQSAIQVSVAEGEQASSSVPSQATTAAPKSAAHDTECSQWVLNESTFCDTVDKLFHKFVTPIEDSYQMVRGILNSNIVVCVDVTSCQFLAPGRRGMDA